MAPMSCLVIDVFERPHNILPGGRKLLGRLCSVGLLLGPVGPSPVHHGGPRRGLAVAFTQHNHLEGKLLTFSLNWAHSVSKLDAFFVKVFCQPVSL